MVVLRAGMCPGLEEALVRDLRAADIKTVEDLVSSNLEGLAQRCSVSYKALFAIRRVLLAQHSAFPVSGADLYEELLSSTAILSTGNPSLDKLLDSGLFTGEITELSGGPGSGKTQVCFGVAVHVSQQLKQQVIYVDSTGGADAGRLLQMLQTETQDKEEQMEALQRIRIFRVFDVFDLLDCLQNLCSSSSSIGISSNTSSSSRSAGVGAAAAAAAAALQQAWVSGGSVKAVIVDSVSALISPLIGGKHQEGTALLFQVAVILRSLAKDFNLAVLVTNHVTRVSVDGDEVRPGLGISWSHVPRTRILLERPHEVGSSLRSATILKSSRQASLRKTEFDLCRRSRPNKRASVKRKREETDSDS